MLKTALLIGQAILEVILIFAAIVGIAQLLTWPLRGHVSPDIITLIHFVIGFVLGSVAGPILLERWIL